MVPTGLLEGDQAIGVGGTGVDELRRWEGDLGHPLRIVGAVQKNDVGVEQWVIEGGDVMGQVGYCSIRPDGSKSEAQIAFDTFDEVHPGAIDVAPRLDYMDENGLTIQIVYPNILGFAGHLVMGIKDEGYGGRDYSCRDPEGHVWNFGSYDPWAVAPRAEDG